jgi:hypothetical protein
MLERACCVVGELARKQFPYHDAWNPSKQIEASNDAIDDFDWKPLRLLGPVNRVDRADVTTLTKLVVALNELADGEHKAIRDHQDVGLVTCCEPLQLVRFRDSRC